MKNNIFKNIKNFGFSHTLKTVYYKLMKKITKKHKFEEKYFNLVLKYLEKNYTQDLTDKFDGNVIEDNFKVFVCWWQGLDEKTPLIVKKCIESVKNNFKNHEVVVITQKNYKDYVTLPDYILQKFEKGIISITHLSDVLRACLLCDYGGVWIDATCFMTGDIEEEIKGKAFYSNKLAYEQDWMHVFVGKAQWSTFFLAGSKGNPIFVNLKNIWFKYWQKHTYLIDYFFTDFCIKFMHMKCDNLRKMIDDVPYNNPNIHRLTPNLLEEYDQIVLDNLTKDTKLFKLTYKMDYSKKKQNSFYDYVIGNC